MRSFDPNEVPFPEFHRVLLSGVAPRPIAFVSTLDAEGRSNLAPFSFFNAFGVNPPIICFSPAYAGRTGLPKDTMLNLQETKECTVSIVSYEMVHQTNVASAPYAKGVDEFIKAGFTKRPSTIVAPAGVAESPFVLEAKLLHHLDFGKQPGSANMMVCEVVMMHVREEVFDEHGSVDPSKMDQVARLGGAWYTRAKAGLFKLPQPLKPLVGLDQLPEELRNSTILSGNDLGKLATVEALPEWALSAAPTTTIARHRAAKELLEANEIAAAWEALRD